MAKTKTSPSRKLFLVINYIVLTIVSLMCILPFINLLAISFSDKTAVAANAVSFWPVGFNTAAYEFILGNDQFLRALWISVQRTVLGVLVNIILIILTAYPPRRARRISACATCFRGSSSSRSCFPAA